MLTKNNKGKISVAGIIISLIILVVVYYMICKVNLFENKKNGNTSKNNTVGEVVTTQQNQTPSFEQYKVVSPPIAKYPTIDLSSHRLGGEFKTVISKANNAAPNFARKYTIITWGCGSSCENGVIIDRTTGKILQELPRVIENGLKIQVDSSLMIINSNKLAADNGKIPTLYYNWNGESFNLLSSQ